VGEGGSALASLEVDGAKLRYKMAGSGAPILLLHGWGGSIESMRVIFDDFVSDHTVVAVDFPGHGASSLPPTAWGVTEYAESVLRVMDALQVQRPHIIAHSHGGRVTIKLATVHPDRVGKLVLVNSAGIKSPRSWRYYGRVVVAKGGKLLARYGGRIGHMARERLYRAVASKDYASAGPLRETLVKLVNEDLTPLLPHIKSPTLLVWGADDTETPLASAKVMERLIPQARLVVFQNAGHFSYLDQYGKFRLIVRQFLRQ
jgi:pimeloyl-ACP methyl ester carboxylesterase